MQTKLSKSFAKELSKKAGVEISVGGVDIRPFSTLILKDIFVEDYESDTLVHIGKLYAKLSKISFGKKLLDVNELELNKLTLNLYEDKNRILDLEKIISSLVQVESDSIPVDTVQDKSWLYFIKNISISDSKFNYKTIDAVEQDFGMNYDDIKVENLNIRAENISQYPDSLVMDIKNLSCDEASGLKLKKLEATTWITSSQWGMSDVRIESEHSSLEAKHLLFNYVSGKSYWAHFTKKMQLDFKVTKSDISLIDIAYFNPLVKGFTAHGNVTGDVYGTVVSLKGKNINVDYGKNTNIKGSFYMNGLPKLSNTYLDAKFSKLETSIADIESVFIPGLESNYIKLPSNFDKLGMLNYKGGFSGFLTDFIFSGHFDTELGRIATDIILKPNDKEKTLDFSGEISSKDFNIGEMIEFKSVERTGFDIKSTGKVKHGEISGVIKGDLNNFILYGYNYKKLALDGEFSSTKFDGSIKLHDPNIDFDFIGKVDFSKDFLTMNFESNLYYAKLQPLKLNPKDKNSLLSFAISADFIANDIDNINGAIQINKIDYMNSKGNFIQDSIYISSFSDDRAKKLNLSSDLLDAYMVGEFELKDVQNSINQIMYSYFPEKEGQKQLKFNTDNQFNFNIKIKNLNDLTKLIFPELSLSRNTIIKGSYIEFNKYFNLNINCPKFKYGSNSLNKTAIDIENKNNELKFICRTDELSIGDFFKVYNISQNIKILPNNIDYELLWSNWGEKTYSGNLIAHANRNISESLAWNIDIEPGNIITADKEWNFDKANIKLDSSSYEIHDFIIESGEQKISVDGRLSKNLDDKLKIIASNLNIENLNSDSNSKIKGLINGEIELADISSGSELNSKIVLSDFSVDKYNIGNMEVSSKWNSESKLLNFYAKSENQNKKEIELIGGFNPKTDSIDMMGYINSFRLEVLSPLVEDYCKNIKGNLSGNIHITGTTSDINSKGYIQFNNSSFYVIPTNTEYFCNDKIDIESQEVLFDNFCIYDKYNNKACLYGAINNINNENLNLDLALNMNDFMVLDTENKPDSDFFGNLFLSGITKIYGGPSNLDIDLSIETSKNSSINIPLNNASDVSQTNFISFINNYDLSNREEIRQESEEEQSNLKLKGEFKLNPQTKIQVIFDPTVGDIIQMNGIGQISFAFDENNEIRLDGDYIIKEGKYFFSLQNVINKRFELEEGGAIRWKNSLAYEAELDINAIYRVKTTLYDLLLNTPHIDNTRKVNVECKMLLSNQISNPNINFDINFPSLDRQTQSIVSGLFSNEEEINRQILSLLVLNRFYTPEYLRATDANFVNKNSSYAVGVTTSELLSNQLSNWLSQISSDFDIGVSYRPGDDLTKDEIELALSTQIFNDKVSINGNLGTDNNKTTSNDFVGDVDVNVKIDKKGKLQLRAFTRSNDHNMIYEEQRNKQGVGISYKENFNTVKELFRRYLNHFRRQEKQK
ncbi:MAG: translocation/assembly module TamB [Marinifilaceae bacterium]|nr:translocation/assembly module TamB [Marinifilaceae bacterium]